MKKLSPSSTPFFLSSSSLMCFLISFQGGFSAGQSLNDLYSYLPRLKRWVINRPMTFPRCDHGMATVENKIFCVGGRKLNSVSWQLYSTLAFLCILQQSLL